MTFALLLSLLLTSGWLAAIVAAPLLPGWGGAVVYGVGSFICHQIADRSFSLAGYQLPVCARCLGIYAGASVAVAVLWVRTLAGRPPRVMRSRAARQIAVAAAVPTIVTVVLEAMGAWLPSNGTRALAGLPLGGAAAIVVMSALATLHYGECVPQRPTGPRPPQPFM